MKKNEVLAKGVKLGIILSDFHPSISNKLLSGARLAYRDKGGNASDLTVIRVPGSFEIPLTAQKLITSDKYDVLLALGVLIRGETHHFDFVARALTDGLRQVILQHSFPIIFEVLIVDTVDQALQRAGNRKDNNKGYQGVIAALQMYHILRTI